MSFQSKVEEEVFFLCRQTFLSLWSYASPRRHGSSKELCDVLVVCEPHIVIFSVKEIQLNTVKPTEVEMRRWWEKAVAGSVKQLYGAERNIMCAKAVTRSDGSQGLSLPRIERRVIHRISVSLGSKGLVPLKTGDFGKGFVNVFDEEFLHLALCELDTVSDFIEYLEAKETLLSRLESIVVEGGEENLLAVFLKNGRCFPVESPSEAIAGDNWQRFSTSKWYRAKKRGDKISYVWDQLLEGYSREAIAGRMGCLGNSGLFELSNSLDEIEEVLRYMARESRFSRRFLSTKLIDFRKLAVQRRVRERFVPSEYGVAYLFYNRPPEQVREDRIRELELRCYVARNELDDCHTIIGIGHNVEAAPEGFATDFFLFSAPEWTEENRRIAERIKRELGYFKSTKKTMTRVDEYPQS